METSSIRPSRIEINSAFKNLEKEPELPSVLRARLSGLMSSAFRVAFDWLLHVCIFSSTNTELTKEKAKILADFFFKRTLV